MKIAIRLDDITPDMDWEKFRRLEKLLDKYQIAPLLGVVPDNQDKNLSRKPAISDFDKEVKKWKEKGYSLALHGWKHIYTTKKGGLFPLNNFSEFAGVDKNTQRSMIIDGKEKLKKMGIETDIFMAPAHSFDKNTLEVLKETGFCYLTDGFGTRPYQWKGLTFLPISFQKSKDVKKEDGYTTLVFHTNTMNDNDFVNTEKLFEEHKKDFISYKEYLEVPATLQTMLGRVKEYSLATMKRMLMKLYSLKSSLKK